MGHKITTYSVSLAAACSFASGPAMAQTMADPPPAPSQRSDDPFQGISVSLDVAEKKSEASLSLAGYFKKPDLAEMSTLTTRNSLGWKVGVEVPIGGGDNILNEATLDKLGNGTKFSASITLLSYSVGPSRLGSPEFIKLMRSAKAACQSNPKTKESADCDYLGPDPDYIIEHTPDRRLAMNRILYKGYWSGGLKGSISLKTYKWVSVGTLDENKSKPSGYSGTLWLAYYPSDAVSAIKLEGEYSSAPEQAGAEVACKTIVVTPKADCVFSPVSGPIRKDAFVLRGEYRRYFHFGGGKGGIGAALTGSVDTLSGDYGFEFPVYLALPQTQSILPGVKIGYSSKKDDVTVSLFLKTAFSF